MGGFVNDETLTQISVVEFSNEVRALAQSLALGALNLQRLHPVLWAICRSGKSAKAVRQYQSFGYRAELVGDVAENIAAELETQDLLRSAGITDDASAISYMDKVRPFLKGLEAQIAEIKKRCQIEVDALLAEAEKEFPGVVLSTEFGDNG